MPKINGFECLRRLKVNELYKNVPVVIMSTSIRKEDIELCKQLGAATFFSKPSFFEELFTRLKNILSIAF
ncbi:MAG: response regulator [Ferruginibacter sp.]